MPDHDEALSGDILTTLNINFEWRRLISDALQSYADSIIRNLDDSLVDDFRNKFQALLSDLYTEDILTSDFGIYVRDTNLTLGAGALVDIAWLDTVPPNASFESFLPGYVIKPAYIEFEIDKDGYYQLQLTGMFLTLATANNRLLRIVKNGVPWAQTVVNVSGNPALTVANAGIFEVGDIIKCQAFSAAASSLDCTTFPARFHIKRLTYNE